ncbi:MAG: hypothetical protein FJ035_04715 [Chloroflexi bacterium]|nr:hypothetical protein [Chloroflexota bacterium]
MPVVIVAAAGATVSSEAGWAPAPGPQPVADLRPHPLQLAGRAHIASAFPLADADGSAVSWLVTGRDRATVEARRADARTRGGRWASRSGSRSRQG